MMKIIFYSMFLLFILNSWELMSFSLCFLVIMLIFYYNPNSSMIFSFDLINDSISGHLIILSIFIILLMFLSSNKVWENKENKFMYGMLLISMNFILMMFFLSNNLLLFFFWFELILIPMFMLILGWGNQSERFNAGMYMFFYTLFGSLPFLFGIMMIMKMGTFNMYMGNNYLYPMNYMWNIIMIGAFLIKLPMYLFHYWLPKAHVEAPVSGSMILAGILLKLGGYGMYRIFMFLQKSMLHNYIISISLIGGMYTSFMCLRQVDVKALVAYSSIGHMGLLLSGFLTGNMYGYNGGVIMMIGHGLCSSSMFCIMNMIYERMSSRSLLLLRGLGVMSPNIMFWSFLILGSNMAMPPTMNLMSEIMLIGSLSYYCYYNLIFLITIFILSCAYSLFLYSMLNHGNYWKNISVSGMNQRESLVIFMHLFPLMLYFVKMPMFM